MPPVVAAAIITSAATTAATVYSARSSRSANNRAIEAERRALELQLAESRRSNDAALQWERDLEARRREEYDREQEARRQQWDWYQQAMQPYRSASTSALGSLSQMVQHLGGPAISFSVPPPPPPSSAASRPPSSASTGAGGDTKSGAGAGGAASAWAPSSLVRTGSAGTRRSSVSRMATPQAPQMPRFGEPNAAAAFENAMGVIADLVRNLPATNPTGGIGGYNWAHH